jgi:L-histidine Nalpha-methyltransferase
VIIHQRLNYFRPKSVKRNQSFVQEIAQSLRNNPKFIHPKFFYDQKGSGLFEQICQLPEYYLTRTEVKILNHIQNDLKQHLAEDYRLVELGSGSATKTRLILDALEQSQDRIEYFPIDISEILEQSSKDLLEQYPTLQITGIIDTYESGLEFLRNYDDKNNLIAFLGSSFGNFSPDDGLDFLQTINSTMKGSDLFLIGLDLVKEKQFLEKAYDDSDGITSQFNLNVLSRINEELDADFDLDSFEHHSVYNEEKKRIEMYIRSIKQQSANIPKANLSLKFEKDELIHTENSHKYTPLDIQDMMEQARLNIKQLWFDKNEYYSMVLASKA